jgi:DNA-directed RNA polymerase alpha subunit
MAEGKDQKSKAKLRTCSRGHTYYKSSDCPSCPACTEEDKPDNFLAQFSAPARRALQAIGVKTVGQLAKQKKADLLKLHGFGPASLSVIDKVLKNEGYKPK